MFQELLQFFFNGGIMKCDDIKEAVQDRILFSACPHDTKNGLSFWYGFKEILENSLKEPVEFKPIYSFEEEVENLDRNEYHLYYASFATAVFLYQNGYKPVAKFKGQYDEYCVVAKDDSAMKKNNVSFAVAFNPALAYAAVMSLFENIDIVYASSFEEVLNLLSEDKVDIGFVYSETWKQLDEKKKKDIKVLKVDNPGFYHIFMAHPAVYDKLKPVLLSLGSLEEVSEEDILRFLETYGKLLVSSRRLEEHDIAKAVLNSRNVGVIIHQGKIVLANEYARHLLGYSKEELNQKYMYDLVTQEYKDVVKDAVSRRLSGESFDRAYQEIEFLTKDNKKRIVYAFSSTVTFKGRYSGLVIFVDITKQKRFETMYSLLREVNKVITSSLSEEEILRDIAKTLADRFDLKLVWIGRFSENSNRFEIDYKLGKATSYLEYLKEDNELIDLAYKGNTIVILSNVENSNIKTLKEAAKEHGFKSLAVIPIKVGERPEYVIGIYSEEPDFFDEDMLDIIKEIKSDIEFGIEKAKSIKENAFIKRIVDSSPSWVLITDDKFRIVYVNNTVSEISLYEKKELIGQNPRIFKSKLTPSETYEELYKAISNGETFCGIFINKRKDGELFYLDTTIYPIEIAPGVKRYISIGKDITKEIELSSENATLKHSDVLTGLLSLEGFRHSVSVQLKKHEKGFFALIDIWGFTSINKTYGIEVGNKVLQEIALRLRNVLEEAILSRTSADEFGIFKPVNDKNDIHLYVPKIKNALQKPMKIDDKMIFLHFNAGIASYPEDGDNFDLLYENASVSLRRSKQKGENVIEYFDKGIEHEIERINIAQALVIRALEEDLFVLYYQPFFDTKDLKLAGFEALVRIKDKDGTVYSPGIFIDFLEKSSYVFEFEKWLVKKVNQKSEKWGLPISFNISARSFKNEEHMKQISPVKARVIMEITERTLLEGSEKVKNVLDYIKQFGYLKVAIDDFGTEYSSLKYIKDLPIDEIKIDISFTRSMMHNEKDRALVEAIINISKKLGFKTLAEGVETKEQLEVLRDMGCDYVQGYLLGGPMSEEQVEDLLAHADKASVEGNI